MSSKYRGCRRPDKNGKTPQKLHTASDIVSQFKADVKCINFKEQSAKLKELFDNTEYSVQTHLDIRPPEPYTRGIGVYIRVEIFKEYTILICLNKLNIEEYLKYKINCDGYSGDELAIDIINVLSNNNINPSDNVTKLLDIDKEVTDNIYEQLREIKNKVETSMEVNKEFKKWIEEELPGEINMPLLIHDEFHLRMPQKDRKIYGPIAGIRLYSSQGINSKQMNLPEFIENVLPEIKKSKKSNEDSINALVYKLNFSGKMKKNAQSIKILDLEKWLNNASKWTATINIQLVSSMFEDSDCNSDIFPFEYNINYETGYIVNTELEIPYVNDPDLDDDKYEHKYITGGPYIFTEKYTDCSIGLDDNEHRIFVNPYKSSDIEFLKKIKKLQDLIPHFRFNIA